MLKAEASGLLAQGIVDTLLSIVGFSRVLCCVPFLRLLGVEL